MALITLLANIDRTEIYIYAASAYFLFLVLRYIRDPLRSVPGPFLTRFTRLWELHAVRKGNFEKTHFDLHKCYGPVVRLGPNRYSIDDAKEADQLYRHGTKFTKADFYHAFGNPNPIDADTFSERSSERHAFKRRKISSLNSMSTLVGYEQFVDRCNSVLSDKMREFANAGVAFEVPAWMQFYAFDVIGEISVGESFGFMERGYDFNGILKAIHTSLTYGSRVGLLAELHPVFSWIAKTTKQPIPFDKVQGFIDSNVEIRKQGGLSSDRNDFLTKLLDMRKNEKINDLDVATSLGANIAAGSDTTAISLSTIVYYLAKNPEKAEKLRHEIRDCENKGSISDPITFKEAQEMPYLQAIIKEALRIHPATGQILSRLVPAGGAIICGYYFPEGTEVGTSPWLTHFDETIFGPDTRSFIPERWLGSDEQTSKMNQNMLALYRRYDFELVKPDEDWELDMIWFVKQSFKCRVKSL